MVLMITQQSTGLMGPALLLDCYSSKQRRVVRSTYAAELHAAIDNLERGYMAQFLLSELTSLSGSQSARQLLSRWQAGSLKPNLRLLIDAKSVYDTLTAVDFRTPAEESLSVPVRAVRDDIHVGKIAALAWLDTRSMLADALTKGVVKKDQIVLAADGGRLRIPAEHVLWHRHEKRAA
eukprot:4768863-Amphidinium_carterae.1